MAHSIRKLHNADTKQIQQLLQQDPKANLYLLDLLDRQGVDYWGLHRWIGAFHKGKLVSVNADIACVQPNHPCKLSVPFGDKEGCRLLGEYTKAQGGTERIMAERIASDAFYIGLGSPAYSIKQDQKLMYAEQSLGHPFLSLEPAKKEEFPIIFEYTALMRVEDEGYDPRVRDYNLWHKTVEVLMAQQRIWVSRLHTTNDINFVIEVGTRCSYGAQVGSVYVPPPHRGHGIGPQGMRGIVEVLLQQSSMVTLLVHEENAPACRCYDKAGFHNGTLFRLFEMYPT